MGINFSKEYKKFRLQQERNKKAYAEMGMPQECIDEICELDNDQFLNNCRHLKHNISIYPVDNVEEGMNPLIKSYPDVLIVYQQPSMSDRFWWIDEIESPMLVKKIKKLSLEELEMLTMYVFEDMTQAEIGSVFGIGQKAVSKRLKKIKEKIF